MEISKLVQLGRERATEAARNNYKHAAKISKPLGEKEWRKHVVTLHCITFWTNTLQSKAPL
jgi:hypothetical protein